MRGARRSGPCRADPGDVASHGFLKTIIIVFITVVKFFSAAKLEENAEPNRALVSAPTFHSSPRNQEATVASSDLRCRPVFLLALDFRTARAESLDQQQVAGGTGSQSWQPPPAPPARVGAPPPLAQMRADQPVPNRFLRFPDLADQSSAFQLPTSILPRRDARWVTKVT